LNEFWGVDPEINELRTANQFVQKGMSARDIEGFSLGERSALGRFFQKQLALSTAQYGAFIQDLVDLLLKQGLLFTSETVDAHRGLQLSADCVIWQPGDGKPPAPDPLYSRRGSGYEPAPARVHSFFQRFYQD